MGMRGAIPNIDAVSAPISSVTIAVGSSKVVIFKNKIKYNNNKYVL
jgi:hypothetical protein